MGCKIDAQSRSTSEYVRAVKEWVWSWKFFDSNSIIKYKNSHRISNIIFLRIFHVFNRIEFIYQFTKTYRREVKALKTLHGFTNSVISSRRNELANAKQNRSAHDDELDIGIKKKTAFLDVLLQVTIDGKPLSDEDIREEVNTFIYEVC